MDSFTCPATQGLALVKYIEKYFEPQFLREKKRKPISIVFLCILSKGEGTWFRSLYLYHILLTITFTGIGHSHTFLVDNHVRLHSSQNASNTGNVYDKHLRLTTKPHLGVISGTFHTKSTLTCGYAPPTIY